MRFLLHVNGLFLLTFSSLLIADNGLGTLADDCYREWSTRGWTIGEDQTPAVQVPRFSEGIKRVCELRSVLHADDKTISPYIQGRLADIAPYVFINDDEVLKQYIVKLKDRDPGPVYSGTFLSD